MCSGINYTGVINGEEWLKIPFLASDLQDTPCMERVYMQKTQVSRVKHPHCLELVKLFLDVLVMLPIKQTQTQKWGVCGGLVKPFLVS